MTLEKVKAYLKELDEKEANNDWLPSPHEIEPYIDFIQNCMNMHGNSDELFELEDRLCDHFRNAYEQ